MIKDIRFQLENIISHVTFEYDGLNCGVDPFSRTNYDVWCGEETYNAHSIDEVMTGKFFKGKSLEEIADDIVDVEL